VTANRKLDHLVTSGAIPRSALAFAAKLAPTRFLGTVAVEKRLLLG
jgi:hypothetical protein